MEYRADWGCLRLQTRRRTGLLSEKVGILPVERSDVPTLRAIDERV